MRPGFPICASPEGEPQVRLRSKLHPAFLDCAAVYSADQRSSNASLLTFSLPRRSDAPGPKLGIILTIVLATRAAPWTHETVLHQFWGLNTRVGVRRVWVIACSIALFRQFTASGNTSGALFCANERVALGNGTLSPWPLACAMSDETA
jgi:hypothetical protein